jgi:hypothetical protein
LELDQFLKYQLIITFNASYVFSVVFLTREYIFTMLMLINKLNQYFINAQLLIALEFYRNCSCTNST